MLLSSNTIYCTDNECIRYLAAAECMTHMVGEKRNFLETNRKVIDESWKKSVIASKNLIDYLLTLKPCRIISIECKLASP